MSTWRVTLAALCCCLAGSVSAETANTETKFILVGEYEARKVCKAVLEDDPGTLTKLLMHHRNGLMYGYKHDLLDDYVIGAYTCNDQSIDVFAMQVGAQKVNQYFKRGIITIEEMVTSID